MCIEQPGCPGTFLLQEPNRKTATVNRKRYQAVLDKFWKPVNDKHSSEEMKLMWFQQDGAPSHIAKKTME